MLLLNVFILHFFKQAIRAAYVKPSDFAEMPKKSSWVCGGVVFVFIWALRL